jgi:hypothetical protein
MRTSVALAVAICNLLSLATGCKREPPPPDKPKPQELLDTTLLSEFGKTDDFVVQRIEERDGEYRVYFSADLKIQLSPSSIRKIKAMGTEQNRIESQDILERMRFAGTLSPDVMKGTIAVIEAADGRKTSCSIRGIIDFVFDVKDNSWELNQIASVDGTNSLYAGDFDSRINRKRMGFRLP